MALPSSYNGLVRGGEDTCDGLPPLPFPPQLTAVREGEGMGGGRELSGGNGACEERWEGEGVVVVGSAFRSIDIDIDVYWSNPQQSVAITTPRQEIKTWS